jgi:predicted AlkP superfamily phosphohydrolase/phosphomutase
VQWRGSGSGGSSGRARAVARAALGVALAFVFSCGGEPVGRAPRVLVVGIDGATFRVIGPLFEQERLPVLRELTRRGAWGPLRASPPLFSPLIWNAMSTGKTADRHGIVNFVRDTPEGRRLYLSSDRKVPALWNMLSDRGVTVSVVNWWNTFPPERIAGVMVSDHFFPSQVAERESLVGAEGARGMAIDPPEWGERGLALLAEDAPLPGVPDPFAGEGPLPRWIDRTTLAKHARFDVRVARVALAIEAELEPQVLMVLLTGIDRVSHHLWGVMEPPESYPPELRPTPEERAAGRAALEAYYEFTDALIRLLGAGFGEDDLVLVVSDHGFENVTFEHVPQMHAQKLTGGHEGEKARDGVVFAAGRGIAHGPTEGMTVHDVTPTILAWLGLPVGADMDGRPAAFLGEGAVASIPTWDATPVERRAGDSGAEETMIEQLRELGYVE